MPGSAAEAPGSEGEGWFEEDGDLEVIIEGVGGAVGSNEDSREAWDHSASAEKPLLASTPGSEPNEGVSP